MSGKCKPNQTKEMNKQKRVEILLDNIEFKEKALNKTKKGTL